MYNVVMLIRYYCFLVLVNFVYGDCERQVYKIPIVDPQCFGQRSIVVSNVYGCRGNCESVSQPRQVTTTSGVTTIRPVTNCKCCSAIEVERRTFTARCRKRGIVAKKTYEILSAVTCSCRSCGPDTYEFAPSRGRDTKRKRNRSIASFDEWGEEEQNEEAIEELVKEGPTSAEGSAEQHSSQSTNYRDSDRLR